MSVSGVRRFTRTLCGIFAICAVFAFESINAQEITYIHTNHLGSPILTTDSSGQVVWQGTRRSYGDPSGSTGQNKHKPIGFTGGSDDAATGLVYLINRYYDPSIGRFISVDPIRFKESNTALFNRYAYANNNPVMNVDPDGLESVGEIIDRRATAAAEEGRHFATYGWAFAGTAWTWLGAEGTSQVFDKGLEGSTTGDKVGASLETLGIIPLAKIAQVIRNRGATETATELAQRLGREGEDAAGIVQGAKETIPSLTGTAAYRVPDELTHVTLREIKNVAHLSNTAQLRDFLAYAQREGLTFILQTRPNTTFSGPLQELIDQGFIVHQIIGRP